jgi:hypothetical protein
MNKENLLQELKEDFIQAFIEEGYTETEAIESWEVFNNTYRDYLAKFSLPGALDNYTEKQILDYLVSSGELTKIKEIALNRLDSIK